MFSTQAFFLELAICVVQRPRSRGDNDVFISHLGSEGGFIQWQLVWTKTGRLLKPSNDGKYRGSTDRP
jgi:hypothetical protein